MNPGRKSQFLSDCSIVGNVRGDPGCRAILPLPPCILVHLQEEESNRPLATLEGSNPLPCFSKLYAAKVLFLFFFFLKEKALFLLLVKSFES